MATISYETESAGVKVTNVIFFDATMTENHEGTAEVTEHEVERGADLADHVRPSRPGLSLDVMITNTPTPTQSVGRLQGDFIPTLMTAPAQVIAEYPPRPRREMVVQPNFVQPGPKLPGVPRYMSPARVVPGDIGRSPLPHFFASVFTFPNPRDRLRDLWDALNALRLAGTELRVLTRLQDYDSMLLVRVGGPVTAQDAITFNLVFKQVGYSDSLVFEQVSKVARVGVKKAQAKKDEGPKDPYTVGANTMKSVYIRGIEWLTGYKSPDQVLAGK